jgi:hypothetical protein
MDLQPTRQFDYLQRSLSIFLTNSSDMSEQFESLIDELIQENKQINKSPKVCFYFIYIYLILSIYSQHSPEPSSSDLQPTSTSPQPLPVSFYSSEFSCLEFLFNRKSVQHQLQLIRNLHHRNG